MWYMIYNTATGLPLSDCSAEPVNLPSGQSYVQTSLTTDRPSGVWDPATRSFQPVSPQPVYLTMREYLNRFTDVEYLSILEAAKTDAVLNAAYARLNLLKEVKINGERTIAIVSKLETDGIIGPGRAAEVLSV